MKDRIVDLLQRYLVAATRVYFTFLFGWAAVWLISGDRFPVIALLNIAALYLFAPLEAVLPTAVVTYRSEIWAGLAESFAVAFKTLFAFITKRDMGIRPAFVLSFAINLANFVLGIIIFALVPLW